MTIITDASTKGWSTHKRDFQTVGTWSQIDHKLHINCLELKDVSYSASLGLSSIGPSGHGCYVQYHGSVPYQQEGDTVLLPTLSSSGSIPVVTLPV